MADTPGTMADGAIDRLVSLFLVLGVLLPGLVVWYAEAKRVHWPGEEASMFVRDVVERGLKSLGKMWTVTKLVITGRN